MQAFFQDRADAGKKLAERLRDLRRCTPVIVGIAPGGVPLAYEVARALDAPLDAWAVRQLHTAEHPEIHLGAIAEDHRHEISLADAPGSPAAELRGLAEAERPALARATEQLRHRPRVPLRDRTVVVIDDGLATGATVRAAVHAIRQEKPHRVIVAVPIVVEGAVANVDRWVDDLVWLVSCESLPDLHAAYARLGDVEDASVTQYLDRRRHELDPRASTAAR